MRHRSCVWKLRDWSVLFASMLPPRRALRVSGASDYESEGRKCRTMKLKCRIGVYNTVNRALRMCVLLALVLTSAVHVVFAGPLPPCTKAAGSKNGKFLVISNMKMRNDDPHRVEQTALEIFSRERFINDKDRLESPNTYWSALQWRVVLDSKNSRPFELGCPLAMLTDDGKFLIVVNRGVSDTQPALRIFRRHHYERVGDSFPDEGELVKAVTLDEISGRSTKSKPPYIATDETPEWFSGGSFGFSSDAQQLIYTRRAETVRISLNDGVVRRDESSMRRPQQ